MICPISLVPVRKSEAGSRRVDCFYHRFTETHPACPNPSKKWMSRPTSSWMYFIFVSARIVFCESYLVLQAPDQAWKLTSTNCWPQQLKLALDFHLGSSIRRSQRRRLPPLPPIIAPIQSYSPWRYWQLKFHKSLDLNYCWERRPDHRLWHPFKRSPAAPWIIGNVF